VPAAKTPKQWIYPAFGELKFNGKPCKKQQAKSPRKSATHEKNSFNPNSHKFPEASGPAPFSYSI
jgi:hypothetical protein